MRFLWWVIEWGGYLTLALFGISIIFKIAIGDFSKNKHVNDILETLSKWLKIRLLSNKDESSGRIKVQEESSWANSALMQDAANHSSREQKHVDKQKSKKSCSKEFWKTSFVVTFVFAIVFGAAYLVAQYLDLRYPQFFAGAVVIASVPWLGSLSKDGYDNLNAWLFIPTFLNPIAMLFEEGTASIVFSQDVYDQMTAFERLTLATSWGIGPVLLLFLLWEMYSEKRE